jgi:hypothetical protein
MARQMIRQGLTRGPCLGGALSRWQDRRRGLGGAASISSNASSSCAMVRSIFSEEAPKRARRSAASCAFSFTISVSRDCSRRVWSSSCRDCAAMTLRQQNGRCGQNIAYAVLVYPNFPLDY